MTVKNRQIKTGSEEEKDDSSLMKLEVQNDNWVDDKFYTKGQTFSCSRSQAKRLLTLDGKLFKAVLD